MNKLSKKQARLKRSRKFRMQNKALSKITLSVHKTSRHIYAQIIDVAQGKTLASASSLSAKLKNGGNIEAATKVGDLIAKSSEKSKIKEVTFDRAGFKFHGRIKALAQAARDGGLKF